MQLELADKTALVTGASRGIGRAIAQALLAEGCRVAINGRNRGDLDSTAALLPGSVPLAGDVTRPEDARRIVAEATAALGALDILICNVGSGRSVPPGEETPDEWQRMLALNLASATNMVEAARGVLRATRGTIVCISSICGLEVVPGAPVTYAAAKAALNAYVRGIARPLGREGIRINAVAPGNILFDGSVWEKQLRADPAAVETRLAAEVSLQRLGTPDEIADMVVYLASPRAAFATGAVWTLDGGQVRSS